MNRTHRHQQKMLKTITHKLKDGQFILTIEDIWYIPHHKLPLQQTLVITTNSVYFYENSTLRKYIKVSTIHKIVLTPLSNEMVICSSQIRDGQDRIKENLFRISSEANVRIIKNILQVKQKFLGLENKIKEAEKLDVILIKQKILKDYVQKSLIQQKSKANFLNYFFSADYRKRSQQKKFQQLANKQIKFSVNLKNFTLLIGQKMYEQIYTNIKLLYINSDRSFLFLQDLYEPYQVDERTTIFNLKKSQGKKQIKSFTEGTQSSVNNSNPSVTSIESQPRMLLRKITKGQTDQNDIIANKLSKYKNRQYKQEIRYALQTETHYQVIIPLQFDEEPLSNKLIYEDCTIFSQKDIRSVFFKLIQMIQDEPKTIFHSLSLQNIRQSKQGGIKISEIFCGLKRNIQLDYLSPQQIHLWHKNKTQKQLDGHQIQLLNVWKIGVLIFEMAYGNIPFPFQIILDCFLNKNEMNLNFPQQIFRTFQFKTFIQNILQSNPLFRAGPDISKPWKSKINSLQWVRLK